MPTSAPETTFLISDLHLCEQTPDLTAILLKFLERDVGAGTHLYILGDLFEAWVGDDDPNPLWATVARAFSDAHRRGATLWFMHGNRDFLVGAEFAARASLTILTDPTILDLGGRRTLLTHGDRYSTGDEAYQAFRLQTRQPQWQHDLLARPLAERLALARSLRAESVANADRNMLIGDAVLEDVLEDARRHDVDRIIHGHTHRPASHIHPLADGRSLERVVLADWRAHGESLELFHDGSFKRHTLRS